MLFLHKHLHASFMLEARIKLGAQHPAKHGETGAFINGRLPSCKVYRYYIVVTLQGFARESCRSDHLEQGPRRGQKTTADARPGIPDPDAPAPGESLA